MKLNSLSSRNQFIILVSTAMIVRLGLAWIFGSEVADISLYHQMADIIGRAENIYKASSIFHYTPIAMFLPYWCLTLADYLKLPFHFVIKWPSILADTGIALLLWQQAIKNGASKYALLIGLAYSFNPVSLLITAFHGSDNIIQIFFLLLAYFLITNGSEIRNYKLSALCLGIAIGFRGFPVLFVPFFLRKSNLNWRQKVFYLILAALPAVVTLIPFLVADYQAVWHEIFSYSGFTDYGWIAVARSYWYIATKNMYLPGSLSDNLLTISKWMFLSIYVLYAAYFWWKPQRFNLLSGIIGTILMFYGFYGGISSQYLVWIIPFAILVGSVWGKIYTWTATSALICFYLFYFPKILFGSLPVNWTDNNPNVMIYTLISNIIFWVICLLWLSRIIRFPPSQATTQKPIAIDISLEENNK